MTPEPSALLNIAGLTPGGVGIWVLVALAFVGVARVWVTGMPDRQRADNEGRTAVHDAEEEARAALFRSMQDEIARLTAKVERLETRVADLEQTEREHIKTILELRAGQQVEGRVRQVAAMAVAADRADSVVEMARPQGRRKTKP